MKISEKQVMSFCCMANEYIELMESTRNEFYDGKIKVVQEFLKCILKQQSDELREVG